MTQIDDTLRQSAEAAPARSGALRVTHLRVEYREDGLGIGTAVPRFSWEVVADGHDVVQRRRRLRMAGHPDRVPSAELWDSGWVDGDDSLHVEYAGAPLRSRQQVWWTVEVEDDRGRTAVAEPAMFELALLDPGEWAAGWVQAPASIAPAGEDAVVYLRTEFDLPGRVRRARAHVSALGHCRLRCNGTAAGDERLAPGWTDYAVRVPYRVVDVTSAVRPGRNAVGLLLGEGWYAGRIGWQELRAHYGDRPQALLQLEVDLQDGSRHTVVTDPSWRVARGPVVRSGMLFGEEWDGRRRIDGWDSPGFDDVAWMPVEEGPGTPGRLEAAVAPPVRVREVIAPVAVTDRGDGHVVADLGTNIVGWPRLRCFLGAGQEVILATGEILDADGSVYRANLRQARATDTLVGAGELVDWEPSFTYHGFRYVDVVGLSAEEVTGGLRGLVAHTDAPATGRFTCSTPLVQRLHEAIQRGQRGNIVEVPTDCPQRDERLGWTGDATAFMRTAVFGMDLATFFEKWVVDLLDAQRADGAFPDIAPHLPKLAATTFNAPAWGDAGVVVPWLAWERYGDRRLVLRAWEGMTRYVDNLVRQNPDGLRLHDRGADYGDWLSIEADTPKEVLATAFFAHVSDLLGRLARALGNAEAQRRYEALFAHVSHAFRTAYVAGDGRIRGETQTVYALALRFGLLDGAGMRAAAARHLAADVESRGGRLSTGFVGVPHLLPALSDHGYDALAHRLLVEDGFPSWGFSLRHGATTIWERWDGWTPERGFQATVMNSFNHYALGSVGEWMYERLAGIAPAAPGFTEVRIHPSPGGGIRAVAAEHHSVRGPIRVAWERGGEAGLRLDVDLPANTRGTVVVPSPPGTAVTVDVPASSLSRRGTDAHLRIGSGARRITVAAL